MAILKKTTNWFCFQDQLLLNAGQKYCKMRSILQYFCPSLSYHVLLISLFGLFLSGCFTQVLLYYHHLNNVTVSINVLESEVNNLYIMVINEMMNIINYL